MWGRMCKSGRHRRNGEMELSFATYATQMRQLPRHGYVHCGILTLGSLEGGGYAGKNVQIWATPSAARSRTASSCTLTPFHCSVNSMPTFGPGAA